MIRRLWRSLGPATLGVLASHEVVYAGHDDGHLHAYLAIALPVVVIAASLAWLLTWASSQIRFRDVLGLQAAVFAVMEISERVVGGAALTTADLAVAVAAILVLPLLAAALVAVDAYTRTAHVRLIRFWRAAAGMRSMLPVLPREVDVPLATAARAPPVLR